MKSLVKIVSLVFLIVASSCKEESEEAKAFDAQMKETIQIHDDVMPKMSSINNLITKLEAKQQELEQAEEVDTEQVEMYQGAINNLKDAHDLMMSWMKNFSDSFSRTEINQGLTTTDADSIKSKLETLEVQYKSAKAMKEGINEAIGNAKILLEE